MDAWGVFRRTDEAEQARRADEHGRATVREHRSVSADWLKQLCLDAGAADVGLVEIGRVGLGGESDNARRLFPRVRTLVAIVTSSNPDAIRSLSKATANLAWHMNHVELDDVANHVVRELNAGGISAVATSTGLPMRHEPGQTTWEIAHKVVAVEAGLGHMGINRMIIHPQYGHFVLLETILIDADVHRHDRSLDYNPCNGCNLCVATCPVGAVRTDDHFDFFACLQHNYREFLFGFEDWVDTIFDAGSSEAYSSTFTSEETRSMWQSLSFDPKYKSAYCQAVCPAGDDIIGPYARSAIVTIVDGRLDVVVDEAIAEQDVGTVDAVVELTGDDHIRLLHPEQEPGSRRAPTYRLVGDAGALGALIGCLS